MFYKRYYNYIFLTFLIIIGLFTLSFINTYAQEAADPSLGCYDTDDGKNYYKKGEATDFLMTTPVSDYCTKNGLEVFSCIPPEGDENCGITEKYCTNYQRVSGGYLSGDDFITICPYGCQDGACIIPEVIDENSCFDSEEKKNYSNKGEVVALGGNTLEEYCHSKDHVMEYYCQDNNVFTSLYYCPNGCFDGACLDIDQYQKPDSECNETDDGYDIYNYGYVYDTGTRNSDECFDNELLEYYCENGEKKHKQIICENDCINGACLAEKEECFDSDGIDYNIKGYATSTEFSEVKYDYCHDYSVYEYYCGGTASSTLLNQYRECEAFCFDGACTRDISDCQMFSGNDQEKCYIGFARYEKDTSICNNISRDGPKFTCIREVARALSDISLCNLITNTSNRASCIINFAEDANDPEICTRTMSTSININAYYQAMCYRHLNDSQICCRIEDERFRDICDMGPPAAFVKYGTEFCEIFEFSGTRKSCIDAIPWWLDQDNTVPDSYVCGMSPQGIDIKNKLMHSRLRGKIILKVESAGEAYYVNPNTNTMHYLGRPNDAFNVMREQGIGITNANLEKIPVGIGNLTGTDSDNDGLPDLFEDAIGSDKNNPDTDGDGHDDKKELQRGYSPVVKFMQANYDYNFGNNQKGRIFLQVERNGEAWYINPSDGKRYFLGRPADAFQVMRNLGLGISNNDFDSL